MPSEFSRALEKARLQLLDTSTRNRLLSIPQNGRVNLLNVVDELSDEVFRMLCAEGKGFTFLEVKERDASKGDEELDELGPMIGQPDDEDEEADRPAVAARHIDTKLQTALGSEALQKRLLSLHYDARTAVEETGVNTLFLALGQLKWRDDRQSEVDRYAPLLFIPVELTRKGAKSRFKLSALESEASENLSLAAKLKSMGIAVPGWIPDEESTPGDYFAAFAQAVAEQNNWEVIPNRIVLAMFSFAKFLMHRDLDPETWPEDASLDSHELVSNLMGAGFPESNSMIPQDANLDDIVPVGRLSHVIDADSSQAIAVEEVRNARNVIIQGPPGTGKSQTITNLIATAVLDGKRVLFVAEKLAALEVVKRRLDALGLGPLALELHSHKSDKKSVLAELGATLELGSPAVNGREQTAEELDNLRVKLNAHAKMLNEPREPSGLSAMKVIGRLCGLRDQIDDRNPAGFDGALEWTPEARREREHLMDDLESRLAELGHPTKHPWRGVTATVLTKFDGDAVADLLPELDAALARLVESGRGLAAVVKTVPPSDMTQIKGLLIWSEAMAKAPDLDVAALAASAWKRDVPLLRAVVTAGQEAADVQRKFGDHFIDAAWTMDVGGIRRMVAVHGQSFFRFLNSGFRKAMAEFRSLLREGTPPKEQRKKLELLDALTTAGNARREIDEHGERAKEAFGDRWCGSRSDWGALLTTINWVEEIKARTNGDDFFEHVAKRGIEQEACREGGKAVMEAQGGFVTSFSSIAGMVKLDLESAFGSNDLNAIAFETLKGRIGEWKGSVESLHSWVTYWNRVTKCNELGVGSIPSRIKDCTLEAAQARLAFDYGYLRQLYNGFAHQTPELAEFDGHSHSALVERFRENDLKRIDLARYEVMQKHFEGLPRGGASSMGALGILKGELARKRGHMPIRKLLARTEGAMQAIKPVFMMSPMSVAQFLEPGTVDFDLVIFDEASQIEPVDALGAIARAKQIVVVGDEKQLPPSNFFASLGLVIDDEDEADDGAASAGDMESLLGLANAKGLPSTMLRWHYRSRHQSLIAVSNHEFYDDKLFIIPSPQREHADVGLGFTYVKNGVFDRGKSYRNPEEAKVVAQRVIEHAEARPGRSLGIGAFSVAQRDAILDELEILRRQRPDLEDFFYRHEHEPFFVKNLENLQGDERDVIYVSLGYGKDKDGFFGMNFGPLNREGGERRLNVLISRAKERCEVFASIHADEIDLNRSKKRGVAALKTFLNFAETGILGTADPENDRGVESPFEEAVKREIEREGYTVHPQVGTAGFFIDLAVVDPAQPSRYLLGIECDGASYHSARSARERDRQREAVLRSHGWKIHRIWSTDWFVEPKKQLERVLKAIEDARATLGSTSGEEDNEVPEIEPTCIERAPQRAVEEAVVTPAYVQAEYCPETEMGIHEVDTAWMAELVLYILKIEAPIHVAEVITRVRELWDVGRAGSRIKAAITKAVKLLGSNGRIAISGDFLSLPDQDVLVRDRSEAKSASLRKPEMLPPMEIREAVKLLVGANHGVGADEMAVGVGRMLGFKSTSKQLRAVVDREVEGLVDCGVLVESGGFLKLGASV